MMLLKIILAWAKACYSRASHKVWVSLFLGAAGTCVLVAGFLSAVVGVFGNTAQPMTFNGNMCLR